jgi:mRNA deadenylase 3'-5' endonuclease subunit Ccr4
MLCFHPGACTLEDLNWKNRSKSLMKTILFMKPDIICLQGILFLSFVVISKESERELTDSIPFDSFCFVLVIMNIEVDHFKDFFHPWLKDKGYDGLFYKRQSMFKSDGVAIFWKTSRYELHYRVNS